MHVKVSVSFWRAETRKTKEVTIPANKVIKRVSRFFLACNYFFFRLSLFVASPTSFISHLYVPASPPRFIPHPLNRSSFLSSHLPMLVHTLCLCHPRHPLILSANSLPCHKEWVGVRGNSSQVPQFAKLRYPYFPQQSCLSFDQTSSTVYQPRPLPISFLPPLITFCLTMT